jgi:uncharacterized protein (TIGR02996 family)
MSTLSALLEAVRAHPGEDTPRLVLADWYDEFGTCDRHRATAEFIRLSCTGQKALPAKAGEWLAGPDAGAVNCGWRRLVPGLLNWITDDHPPRTSIRAYRTGRWIELHYCGLRWQDPADAGGDTWPILDRCDIEFTRGFVARVVFRDWRFCDTVLPLLLADQPFVDPELTGFCRTEPEWEVVPDPYRQQPVSHPKGGMAMSATVQRSRVGPAFDNLPARDPPDANTLNRHVPRPYALWYSGPENDAEERARAAVSKALLARARQIAAGQVRAGVDVAANADAAAEAELGVSGAG